MNVSNKFIKYFLIIILSTSLGSCKKFLSVDPVTAMSGNNFWKSKDDVEKFVVGTYILLRNYTCMDGYTMLAIGDLRSTAWELSKVSNPFANRDYITFFNRNDIKALRSSPGDRWWRGAYGNFDQNWNNFGIENMTDWGYMYRIITSANTILENINNKDIEQITDQERKQYQAEAVFIRSLTYYLMCRHWGDVPYITNVNDKEKHGRTSFQEIFKSCIKDLKENLDQLPWTYSDPTMRGVRAMKGGALNLMMEMNMWLAGFDEANANSYYKDVVDLGNTLINNNGGAYSLLPLENSKEIFKGNSPESLFEIGQDINYNETFGLLVTLADIVLRTPYKKNVPWSIINYSPVYLRQLYESENNGTSDKRQDYWFEKQYMYDNTGQFVFTKFINTFGNNQENENPNDNKILFRYANAFLLKAEAEEKLGNYAQAIIDINVIRNRAGAEPFTSGQVNQFGQTLEDAIWWERERELMGEGTMYYDLVRSKKIMNAKYTPYPMTYDDFRNGAWTYPINDNILQLNPKIKPNSFWL